MSARLLDTTFRYVPANKTAEEGVLARWLASRKNMGESSAVCHPDNSSHSAQESEEAINAEQVARHNEQVREKA